MVFKVNGDDREADVDELIADVAFVFHWPLSELEALDLDELIAWHGRANDRMKAMLKMKADIMAAAR